jgi:DNA-directed RNA polymerase specialized sigma24 family protein
LIPGQPSVPEKSLSLKERLADAWRNQRIPEFYATIIDELQPKVNKELVKDHPALTIEEAEDCFSIALERFTKRHDASIENPESYIWTSARNEARDQLEEKAKNRELAEQRAQGRVRRCGKPYTSTDPDDADNAGNAGEVEGCDTLDRTSRESQDDVAGDDDVDAEPEDINGDSAVILVEALVEDVNAEPSWAVHVVELAVARLRPALGRVVRHLLKNGLDCSSSDACVELGMTAETFRANKSKCFAALEHIIPSVMTEHGIVPSHQRIVQVFEERKEFGMSDEGDETTLER